MTVLILISVVRHVHNPSEYMIHQFLTDPGCDVLIAEQSIVSPAHVANMIHQSKEAFMAHYQHLGLALIPSSLLTRHPYA